MHTPVPATDTDTWFWIIGGGAMQLPLIDEARGLGLRALVTDRDAGCACAPQADRFEAVDIFDIDAHLALADRLRAQGLHIAGVLAAGIDAPETMAALARHLGLPGVAPEIARLVHHKADFRARMAALGFPIPRHARLHADDLPQLMRIAEEIGYPLIIKNTDSSGSRGTRIFRTPDAAAMRSTAEEAIAVSRSRCALMEACWEGSEHTVETIFDVDGGFHPCFITDRHFDKRQGWALETGLRHPSVLDAATQQQMYALAEQVARALGITIGAAKYDMMVTAEGPRIIEMTVRLSGGFDCQVLVPAATGKRVLRAAVLTALGRRFEPALLQPQIHRIGLSASPWPAPGLVRTVHGLEAVRALPGVECVVLRVGPGDRVQPYTDCTRRTAFVIVTGQDEAQAAATLRQALQLLRIETVADGAADMATTATAARAEATPAGGLIPAPAC